MALPIRHYKYSLLNSAAFKKAIDLPCDPPSISPINTCGHRFFFPTTTNRGSKGNIDFQSTPAVLHLQIIITGHRASDDERQSKMSRRGSRGGGLGLKPSQSPSLSLNLNLSPPAARARERAASPDEEWSSSSSPSSCLSSEGEREHGHGHGHGLQWSDSPEATSMVLAACPRCLMYVMLSEADPRCPRCRSPVLLDFLRRGGDADGSRNKRA